MEIGLGDDTLNLKFGIKDSVLILVLVEIGLGDHQRTCNHQSCNNVLILVLVEIGLGGNLPGMVSNH